MVHWKLGILLLWATETLCEVQLHHFSWPACIIHSFIWLPAMKEINLRYTNSYTSLRLLCSVTYSDNVVSSCMYTCRIHSGKFSRGPIVTNFMADSRMMKKLDPQNKHFCTMPVLACHSMHLPNLNHKILKDSLSVKLESLESFLLYGIYLVHWAVLLT